MKKKIEQILTRIEVPYLGDALPLEKCIKSLDCSASHVKLALQFGLPVGLFAAELQQQLVGAIKSKTGIKNVDVNISSKIVAHAVQQNVTAINNIKNIIAVASGKGGVGKSTTSVNIALALKAAGASVGILDADIYGPNHPLMLGINDKPDITMDKKFIPIEKYGLHSLSIGYLIDAERPTIWRGPMVSRALEQLTFDVIWPELDYLIVDLPPGTGDIQLTMAQKIPVSGGIIVTTPQEVALADARKAINMFHKVDISVLGIVENMSYYQCKHCSEKDYIFGQGGGNRMAQEFAVTLLGEVPLQATIQRQADKGKPTVIADFSSELAQNYCSIALRAVAQLSRQKKNYAVKFGSIVVENKS